MPQLELVFITAALDKGWVVTVPDHLGTKSAFLANHLSAQATLDNVRAALASTEFTSISKDATVTLWGYSGGSLASGFAAELQPTYAPELNIAGVALGGTVPQILPVVYAVNKGIQGLANEYPTAAQLVADNVLPSKAAEFNKTKSLCLSGDTTTYFGQDMFSYVKDPNIFTEPTATALLGANAMGQHLPKIPLYIYKSAGDEISPVNDTDALVAQYYCSGGASVQCKRDELSEHAAMAILGAPDAFMWLEDRMNGRPVELGCSQSTVLTSLTDPDALAALGAGLVDVLLSLLSAPVGPIMIG
ncbi:secretory lipase, putative [Talaromyces stipitatus ATCC 10500]|uniref:Secretory lipase, putative n=1 Tax=Talaromyces stipitatus (strain ATCC 10500 / CBS 375.48 / QM 6759 / NRRL 1006) TaxID=441959 RepID=B8M7U1_TALSN|nr:secretory lipase, putative [Talaromyces stipitatus ATCC 10500]EED19820.1 secretory lipase, putative [Talaromyces stipitatus ATCC 10500]